MAKPSRQAVFLRAVSHAYACPAVAAAPTGNTHHTRLSLCVIQVYIAETEKGSYEASPDTQAAWLCCNSLAAELARKHDQLTRGTFSSRLESRVFPMWKFARETAIYTTRGCLSA
jgi:hypothetical protein